MKYFLLLAIFIISSCSTDSGVYKKNSTVDNQFSKEPPAPWAQISSEGSDYALANNKTKSLFLFNSACRKYEASTLSSLTSSMLAGIDELKILEKNSVNYQEREAMEVVASGKLDGVIRYFKIVTLQKNNCIYDFVLISTNKNNLDADSPSLKLFLQRIKLN